MATEWYYQIMNETVGPLTGSQLLACVRSGKIKEDTPIRKDDSQWVPAHQVNGLLEKALNNQLKRICPYCGCKVNTPPTTCPGCNRKLVMSFSSRLTAIDRGKLLRTPKTERNREAEQQAIWQQNDRSEIIRYVFLLIVWMGMLLAAPYLIYLASTGRLFFAGDLAAISVAGVTILLGGVYYLIARFV